MLNDGRSAPLVVLGAVVRAYIAILPPPFLVITTTAGRGGMPSLKSGQRVEGSSKVPGALSSSDSPGCWIATKNVSRSGVNSGPHNSAPFGQRKNSFDVPRAGPSVSMAHTPSARPVSLGELPSVAIHKRPMASTAQLSGMPNQPSFVVARLKLAPTAAIEG